MGGTDCPGGMFFWGAVADFDAVADCDFAALGMVFDAVADCGVADCEDAD